MGIYYYAADDITKEIINSPDDWSNKIPGIFHPNCPFPGMVVMKNSYGYNFEIHNDMETCYEYQCSYKDVTETVYNEYKNLFNQPERLNPEALDNNKLYNDDGTLNNPICSSCGLGKWSSLHQGCDSLTSTNK